jgi:hypothetical protein
MEILLKRNAAVDRGPWLTIPDASRESGLRSIVIRRVVMKMMAERSPDVFRDGSVIKVRRAVLGELRAEDLEDPLDNPLPARNGVHPGLLQARVG